MEGRMKSRAASGYWRSESLGKITITDNYNGNGPNSATFDVNAVMRYADDGAFTGASRATYTLTDVRLDEEKMLSDFRLSYEGWKRTRTYGGRFDNCLPGHSYRLSTEHDLRLSKAYYVGSRVRIGSVLVVVKVEYLYSFDASGGLGKVSMNYSQADAYIEERGRNLGRSAETQDQELIGLFLRLCK